MKDQTTKTWICVQCKAQNPVSVSECQKCGFSFSQIFEEAAKHREPIHWVRILGVAAIVIGLMFLVKPWFFGAASPKDSPLARAYADMRALAVAIEAYHTETGQYPAAADDEESVNAALSFYHSGRHIWTFQAYRPDGPKTLTAPTPFIRSYPRDPFSKSRKAVFGYYNDRNKGWILFSPGPDGHYDIDPVRDYDATLENPAEYLLAFTHDPTNGARSSGDLWIIKE